MHYDVIIIGGSYAGLSAALPLARARRNILIIDGGERRNRFAGSSHGFLTQDGTAAAAIAEQGRDQLSAYQTVEWLEAQVTDIKKIDHDFKVFSKGNEVRTAQRIILATGITDLLPEVPGLAERWGKTVFHCPYCHGYELNQGKIGVLATSALSLHIALMLPDWGTTTLFLNQAFELDPKQLEQLKARNVTIDYRTIKQIEGQIDLVMQDDATVKLDGLFVTSPFIQSSPFAQSLGCELEETPLGAIIKTSATKATSIAGVFACGDAARMGGSVSLAVGDGTIAGAAAHQSLIFGC